MKSKRVDDGVFGVRAHGALFRVVRREVSRPVWDVFIKRGSKPHPAIAGWEIDDWETVKTEPTKAKALKWIEQYGKEHAKRN